MLVLKISFFLLVPSFPSLALSLHLIGKIPALPAAPPQPPPPMLFLRFHPGVKQWEALAGDWGPGGREMPEYFPPSFSTLVAFRVLLVSSRTPQLLGSPTMSPPSARTAQTLGFSNPYLCLFSLALGWSQFLLFVVTASGCLSDPSCHPHSCVKLPLF